MVKRDRSLYSPNRPPEHSRCFPQAEIGAGRADPAEDAPDDLNEFATEDQQKPGAGKNYMEMRAGRVNRITTGKPLGFPGPEADESRGTAQRRDSYSVERNGTQYGYVPSASMLDGLCIAVR